MKKIINKVRLEFFLDDATGEWGIAHTQTINDNNYGQKFNAFWNGIGIFHDVFEHYFEHEHKYFKGDYAMNIGGEMCAMGHLWYYHNILGIGDIRRLGNGYYSMEDSIMQTTFSEMQESIQYGYCHFGNTLESNIPFQKSCDYNMDDYILDNWNKCKTWNYKDNFEDERNYAREYKKSVKLGKIFNLHRYGFKMAQKLVPNNWENREILIKFIEFWNNFCKNNNAEEIANTFKYIDFTIYKKNNIISWKAKLISSDYMIKNYEIKHQYEVDYITKEIYE